MGSRVIEIAGIGLLIAVTSLSAAAQDMLGGAPNGLGATPNTLSNAPNALSPAPNTLGGSTLGTLPLPEPWTTDNVPATQPFGKIDVARAGSTTAQVRTWAISRTPQERNELQGRCSVISDPMNSSRYQEPAQEFCRTYLIVAQGTPAPTTKY